MAESNINVSDRGILYVKTVANLPVSADNGQFAFILDTKSTFYFDSNTMQWMPLARFVIKKGNVVVDGKTAGNTSIYTLEPSNLNFYPTQIIVRAVNIDTAIIKPTISIGTNSPNYDNIATGSLLNTVTSLLGITTQPQSVSTSPALAAGSQIYARVSLAATAAAYTFKVDIAGYYES